MSDEHPDDAAWEREVFGERVIKQPYDTCDYCDKPGEKLIGLYSGLWVHQECYDAHKEELGPLRKVRGSRTD
jgi:hypothetical protein